MKHKITIEFEEKDSSLGCGLRVGWLNGTRGKGKKKQSVDLACGAGVGSPWLIFTKEKGGKSKSLIADIRTIIPLLDKLL